VSFRPLSGTFGDDDLVRQRKSMAIVSYGSGTQVKTYGAKQLDV